MSDQNPPSPHVEAPSRSFWRNISVVWLVPVLALLVALGIAWQSFADRGGLIEIQFETGAGVTAGETTVRYRDVVIGEVEAVYFSEDLNAVVVSARIENDILPYLDSDARFWVVQPEISAQGVSGLSTVVSGVYIEGAWNTEAGEALTSFEGLARPLFVRPGDVGRRITLNVDPGLQLSGGTPLIYRGLPVGRLEEPQFVDGGSAIRVEAFIEAPFDDRISEATRFWDSSGFSIDFGADGLSLDVESIASLVSGGIEFDEVYSNGAPVAEGYRFNIYTSEEVARASAFVNPVVGEVPVSVQFAEYTRGLRRGLGVFMEEERIGQVSSVTVHSFDTPDGPERRHVANLLLDPEALNLAEGAGPDEVYAFLDAAVVDGLRARLAVEGLITSEFRIVLADVNNPDPAMFERDAVPFPRIPAVATERSTVNSTAEGVLERVAALPFEGLLTQAIDTLAAIETLAGDDGFQLITDEALTLLTEARGLVGDDTQAIPVAAREAVEALRDIVAAFDEEGSVAALTSAVTSADSVFTSLDGAIVTLPELLENLRILSATAAALELESLVTSADGALAAANAFFADEDLAAVPGELSTALTGLSTLLASLEQEGSVAALTAALTSADTAFTTINGSVAELPALLDNLSTLSARLSELEIEGLVASANGVLSSADAFFSDEDLAAVPGELSTALTGFNDLMTGLEEGSSVEALTSALTSADSAFATLDTASARLPELMNNLASLSETAAALEIEALVTSANTVLGSANAILSNEDLADVPSDLSAALGELESLLAALTAADVVGSLNSTLTAASSAAVSAEAAADELPALVNRTEALLAQIGTLSAAYGPRSDLMAEAMDVLREITVAARSIAQLARTIERNPNSLITGR